MYDRVINSEVQKFAVRKAKTCIISPDVIEHQSQLLFDRGLDMIRIEQLIDALVDLSVASNRDFATLVRACVHVMEH